jgi:FkbM family methyltransferase
VSILRRLGIGRARGSALEGLLDAAGLSLVDVGARGQAPPELMRLACHSRLVAFEPDSAEAARLRRELADTLPWRNVTVVPEALARRDGSAELYLTEHPGMSSLLPPDDAVARRYWKAAAFRVTGTKTIPTMTLDAAAYRYGFEDACYIKLDTQGTELDILLSGPDLLRRSVVGIYVETLFQPFYEGQSLFGDVDAHLRGLDFVLVDMRPWFMRAGGFGDGLYSRRQPVWAHCLYLRDAAGLAGDERALMRYVALALAYEHFDLALATASSLGDNEVAGEIRAEAEAATVRERDVAPPRFLRPSGPGP